MKKQDIETYIRLRESLEDLASNIYDYVYEKYKEWLSFYRQIFTDFSLDKDGLEVKYENCYENDYDYLPEIPIALLNNERAWKKFLDEYYAAKKKKKQEAIMLAEKEKERRERELLKELKEKYETF